MVQRVYMYEAIVRAAGSYTSNRKRETVSVAEHHRTGLPGAGGRATAAVDTDSPMKAEEINESRRIERWMK